MLVSFGRNKQHRLLAEKDTTVILLQTFLREGKSSPVIPPRKRRNTPRDYDKYLYGLRHLVEHAFLELKCWRGIATRYTKNTASFLAAVHIRGIAIWAKFIDGTI